MTGEVTDLLRRVSAGDMPARDSLYNRLYTELTQMARSHLARAGTLSLDAPALLHEAYLRLAEQDGLPDANRHQFFSYASKVMRSVIIDYVRERRADKRGAGVAALTLNSGLVESALARHSIDDIESALVALEQIDARACRVVEMRYFGGLSESEIAGVLDVSLPTVKRDWRKARAFLYEQLR